jgi:hypothetical protein
MRGIFVLIYTYEINRDSRINLNKILFRIGLLRGSMRLSKYCKDCILFLDNQFT